MNKNRKCGWDHSIAPLSKKKKKNAAFGESVKKKKKSISLSLDAKTRPISSPFIFDL